MIQLRNATTGDSGTLTTLMLTSDAYPVADHAIIASYPMTSDLIETGVTRVAESDDAIVGFYRLDVANSDLDLMLVADFVQGTGLGRVLFDDMIAAARIAGLRSVGIFAHPPAADFYWRMGARGVGVIAPSGRAKWDRPELAFVP